MLSPGIVHCFVVFPPRSLSPHDTVHVSLPTGNAGELLEVWKNDYRDQAHLFQALAQGDVFI